MEDQPYQNNGASDTHKAGDSLASSHEPSRVPVTVSGEVDALLSATVPQVDVRFRRELEEQLIAKLPAMQAPPTPKAHDTRQPGIHAMSQGAAYRSGSGGRSMSRTASFTMGVVGVLLLALLFVGMSALLGSRQPRGLRPDQPGLISTPTWIVPTPWVTPTPEPAQSVSPAPAASRGNAAEFAASLRPWARWKAGQLYTTSLAWSAEGELLAVATSNDVTLRSPTTGQLLSSYKLEQAGTISGTISGTIVGIAWSPDGRVLAAMGNVLSVQPSAGATGFIVLLDASSPGGLRLIDTITAGNMLTQMAWSPNNSTLAYTDGWQAYMWDLTAKREVPRPLPTWPAPLVTHPDPNTTELNAVNSLTWSPDGKRLAMSQNRAVKVSDVESGKEILSIPVQAPLRVKQIVWSPDGNSLAGVVEDDSGARDNVAMVWDAAKGGALQTLSPGRSVNRVAWSSYANVLALGTGGKRQDGADFVVLYDPTTGQILNERSAVGQAVDSLIWSPDGRILAVGSAANETVVIFAPGSGPSPTPAPIESTITPVPTGVTPVPGELLATATEAMPEPPTPIGSDMPDSLRAAVQNLRHIEMVDENNGWGASAVGPDPTFVTPGAK